MTKVQAVLLAVLFSRLLYSADVLAAGRRLPGVVVESASVEPGMATGVGFESYVLAPGDILRFYSCDGKSRPIDSPLDMPRVDVARFACKHELVLSGRRKGIARTWRVSQGAWDVQVGPRFQGADQQLYKTGLQLANSGKREEAAREWSVIESGETWWPWWRELHSAALFADAQEWKRSDALLDTALALIPQDNHVWKAEALYLWANTYYLREDWSNAEQRHREAAEVDDSQIPLLRKLGWHSLRHSYRAWLDDTGVPLGVQQKLMRHANISTTMNVYGGAFMDAKRRANTSVVQRVLSQKRSK